MNRVKNQGVNGRINKTEQAVQYQDCANDKMLGNATAKMFLLSNTSLEQFYF